MNREESTQLGLKLKEKALDRFEGRPWMEQARSAAKSIWILKGSVTIDDVYDAIGPPPSANMAGGVFRTGFVLVGYTTSCKPAGHGNRIGKWRLQ